MGFRVLVKSSGVGGSVFFGIKNSKKQDIFDFKFGCLIYRTGVERVILFHS